MILSESFSILPQNERISKGRNLSLSLWPISNTPLRSSLRSLTYNVLSNTNDLKMISVLAVFSLTPFNPREILPAKDVKRFPVTEFKKAFSPEGFLEPVNLSDNRGFAFFLDGLESDSLSHARCISFEQVLNERMISGNKYSRIELSDLFEVFPVLTKFSVRFPISSPPLTSTSFLPILTLTPFRERLNHQHSNEPIQFSTFSPEEIERTTSSLDCSKGEKFERWKNHLSPIVGTSIFISGDSVAQNGELLKKNGITHIVNCASHLTRSAGDRVKDNGDADNDQFEVLRIPMSDGGDENILSWIFKTTSFIKRAICDKGRVLVHCIQGSSRSASVVIGYLILTRKYDYDKAYKNVRDKRRIASPNPKFMAQLIQLSEIVGARKQKTSNFIKQKEIRFFLSKKIITKIETETETPNEQTNEKFKYAFVMKPKCKASDGSNSIFYVTIDMKNVGDEGIFKQDEKHYKTRGIVIIESPININDETFEEQEQKQEQEQEEETGGTRENARTRGKISKEEIEFVQNFVEEVEDCLRVSVNRTYKAYKAMKWDKLDTEFTINEHDEKGIYVLVDLIGAKLFVSKNVNRKTTDFKTIIRSFCQTHKYDESKIKIVYEEKYDDDIFEEEEEEEESKESVD